MQTSIKIKGWRIKSDKIRWKKKSDNETFPGNENKCSAIGRLSFNLQSITEATSQLIELKIYLLEYTFTILKSSVESDIYYNKV